MWVDFSGRSLKFDTEKDAEDILKALKDKSSMNTLSLSGNTIGVDAARSIGSALSTHKDLTRCLFGDIFTGMGRISTYPFRSQG